MRDINYSRVRTELANVRYDYEGTKVTTYADGTQSAPSNLKDSPIELDVSYKWRETRDTEVANFHARSKAGEVIVNDYDSSKVLVGNSSLTCAVSVGFEGYPDTGYRKDIELIASGAKIFPDLMPQNEDLSDQNLDSALALMVTDLHAKVNQAEWQGLVFMAELHKTFKMFKKIGQHLWKVARRIDAGKKAYKKGLITAAKLSSIYLAGRYALRPLIADYTNAVKALKAALDEEPRYRFSTWTEIQPGIERITKTSTTVPNVSFEYEEVNTHRILVEAGCLVKYVVPRDSIVTTMGLDDIVQAGWELIPYSFVVDWFFNTSQYIAAREFTVDRVIQGSWAKVTQKCDRSIVPVKALYTEAGYGQPEMVVSGAPPISSRERITRLANPSLPHLPRLNVRLDGWKLADLILLLKQASQNGMLRI